MDFSPCWIWELMVLSFHPYLMSVTWVELRNFKTKKDKIVRSRFSLQLSLNGCMYLQAEEIRYRITSSCHCVWGGEIMYIIRNKTLLACSYVKLVIARLKWNYIIRTCSVPQPQLPPSCSSQSASTLKNLLFNASQGTVFLSSKSHNLLIRVERHMQLIIFDQTDFTLLHFAKRIWDTAAMSY